MGVLQNSVSGWDPQVAPASSAAWELARCCLFRTLLSYAAGTTAQGGTELRPDLASALPDVSTDGLSWTFHLRSGLHYAPPLQNVEITAPDVVRGLERLMDPATVGFGWPYFPGLLTPVIEGAQAFADGKASSISGLEVPDPHTLTVRLTRPNGDLGYLLATWMAVPIPPNPSDPTARYGVAQGHPGNYAGYAVSSGPYMVQGSEGVDFSKPSVEQVPAAGIRRDTVTLVRNPSWDPATDPLRPAVVDAIEVHRIPVPPLPNDPDGERAAGVAEDHGWRDVEAGKLDLLLDADLSATRFRRYRDDPAASARVYTAEGDIVNYIGINVAEPPFDDVHVRRALNLVVDRAALLAANEPSGLPLAPQHHIGLDSQEANLLVNYDPFPTSADQGDVAAARQEMSRSHYDRNHDGRCDATVCQSVLLLGHPDFEGYDRLQRELSAIGIGARIRVGDRFYTSYGQPELHVGLRIFDGWAKDYPSAATLFPQFFGGDFIAASLGCCNDGMVGASSMLLKRSGYPAGPVPTVDARIDRCQSLLFQAEVRCWAELDQVLTGEVVAWVPLWVELDGRLASSRVASMTMDQSVPQPLPALDHVALTADAIAEGGSTPSHPSAEPPSSGTDTPALDGTYRLRVSPGMAHAAGMEECDQEQALGTFTLEVSGGRWQMLQTVTVPASVWERYPFYCPQPFPNLYRSESAGSIDQAADRVVLRSDDAPLTAGATWTLAWSPSGSGVDMRVIRGPHLWWPGAKTFPYRPGDFPWAAGTWERIGTS